MPGPRMLLLRQAKNAPVRSENPRGEQTLHTHEAMPDNRMLPELLPKNPTFCKENLSTAQALQQALLRTLLRTLTCTLTRQQALQQEVTPDTRMPLLPEAQKHRDCDGESEG